MAISYIGVSTAANLLVGGTSVALATPGGTANNDLMIAHICIEATGRTITPPAGWTQITVAVNETDHTHRIYRHTANAEPGSRSWSISGGATAYTGVLTVYRGTSVVHGQTDDDGLALLLHMGPGVSANTTGAWLQQASSGMSLLALGWGPPAGMTERADIIGGLLILLNVNTQVCNQGPVSAGFHVKTSTSLDLVNAINALLVLEPDVSVDQTGTESRYRYQTPTPGLAGGMGMFAQEDIGPNDDVQYGLGVQGFVLFNTLRFPPFSAELDNGSCC